jgi:DNA helicase-2/ATP-dependent DNA helicase PcrA
VCNRLLRKYATEVGHTANFTILDEEDSRALIKVCVKELAIDATAKRFPSPANLAAIVSYARNSSRPIAEAVGRKSANFSDFIPTIERVAQLYEARKRAADALDFDDLLLLTRNLLQDNPEIRTRLSTQFQYILVDEYQDINTIQADLIRLLSEVHRNLLVVGDDAQSIYSFRAADIRNILNFPKIFSGTKTFKLTTNYRSTPEILALANAAISHNTEQFEKDLQAVRAPLTKPHLVPAGNSAQEAQFIAEQMLRLRAAGVPLREIAVLFRAAFHSQALEFELMKRDIPYDYRGGMKFFERAHIKDAVAHLRIAANPKDESAWLRVLGLQSGVGLTTAQKIFEQLRPCQNIDEVLATQVRAGNRAEAGYADLKATLRRMTAGNRLPGDMIAAVAASGYRDYLEAEYPDFMDRLEDLEQFAIFAQGYPDLKTFLDEVTLSEDFGAVSEKTRRSSEDRAVLSTIHQAKGLEWNAVFVMGLCEGKFPHSRALEEDGGIEEERRLFYVASTRARQHLFLTYPILAGYDTLSIAQPSRFVVELPQELLEPVRLKAKIQTRPWGGGEDGEPTIVLDELGEEVAGRKKIQPGSFLREIEEL